MSAEGTATATKLREALDANADAAKSHANGKPDDADAHSHAALKLAQALATLASSKLI